MSNADRFDALMDEVRAFVQERDWDQFHDPKNLAMAVASEAGELSAVLRWVHNDDADACASGSHRQELEAEVADIAICLLMLCDRVGIDLVRAAHEKLGKNRQKYPADRVRGKADHPAG